MQVLMNDRVQAIVEEARKLTPGERLELFEQLRAEFSVEADGPTRDVESAWLKEVERCISEAASGEAKPDHLAEAASRARRFSP
jgi:hypothetical protein